MTIANAPNFPENFRRIRLELAREHDHPLGSATHGYDIVAPLSADQHLDADGWKTHKDICRVVRFRPEEDNKVGHLVRRPGGSWAFRFPDEDDEAGLHFDAERFVPGEYVSLRADGEEHTFRVITVRTL